MKKLLLSLLLVAQLTTPQLQQIHDLLTQLAQIFPAPAPTTATPLVVPVAAGADLQALLNAAQPGEVLQLAPGTTFTGNFTLPNRGASWATPIILEGQFGPGRATSTGNLPHLLTPNDSPVLATVGPANGWWVLGLELSGDGGSDLITFGDGSAKQNLLSLVPQGLRLAGNYIHGSPLNGRKRCVALNSGQTVIENNYISDCKAVGQDAQAIAGWNGPGPYTITNNYLEGAGNNLIFGGSDPAIPNLVPSDIVVTNNTFNKPTTWRSQAWQVKNWLELKNAQRVLINLNTFTNVWADAQTGFGIVLTVKNQDGGCPWCIVQDVRFTSNTLSNMAGFLQLLGTDYQFPSLRETGLVITQNTVTDVDPITWGNPKTGTGGTGRVILSSGSPATLEIGHNTIIGTRLNSFLSFASGVGTIDTLNVHDNILPEGDYGIAGDNAGQGRAALDLYAPTGVVIDNAIVQGGSGRNINYGPQSNYLLPVGSVLTGLPQVTTDGKPIGSNQ